MGRLGVAAHRRRAAHQYLGSVLGQNIYRNKGEATWGCLPRLGIERGGRVGVPTTLTGGGIDVAFVDRAL